MRVVLQRVKWAKVEVEGKVCGQIDQGYLLLVGMQEGDSDEEINKLANKCAQLRIFEDSEGKMNLGIQDIQGSILSISQFTLYADCKKGRRPSFVKAMKANEAKLAYEKFNECLRAQGLHVECGIFQADMKVSLLNDGPVTIILDSEEM